MIETCAHALLTGVLAVRNKADDFDRRTMLTYTNADVVYVIPDADNLKKIKCNGVIIDSKSPKMLKMIKNINN